MKLLFGENGVGKSLYTSTQEKESTLILTSRLESWRNGNKICQFADVISDTNKKIDEIKVEVEAAKARSEIGYSGSNTLLKKLMKDFSVYEQMFNRVEDFNEINDIGQLHSLPKLSIGHISSEELNEIERFIKEADDELFSSIIGVTKFYKSLKSNIQKGEEKFISDLATLKIKVDTFIKDKIENKGVELLIRSGNIDLIRFARENNSIDANIITELKKMICENVKYIWGKRLKELLERKQKYLEEQISFDIESDAVSQLKEKFNVGIEFGHSNKELIIEGYLSSGQFTTLLLEIILNSVHKTKKIILDDVLETLDSKNKYYSIKNLLSYENAEVLTHDISTVEDVKRIADEEDIEINIKWFIPKKGSPGASIITWRELLNNMRVVKTTTSIDEMIIRQILKIITRYHAKDSLIHTQKGYASEIEIESSNQWFHWLIAGKFYHYYPNINYNEINKFFPFLSLTSNVSSIELIDQLISRLRRMLPLVVVSDISIRKLINFLLKIKVELEIEEELFDTREKRYSDAIKYIWSKPNNAFKKYKILRKCYGKPPRDNSYIHTTDKFPILITK